MNEIISRTAELFGITVGELRSPSRRPIVSHARQAAAWALRREYKQLSLNDIGRLLGGRDHTTILYGIGAAERRAIYDEDYALNMSALLQRRER